MRIRFHDVIGVNDHYAAGLGEVDFEKVAAYLPEGVFRTCEYQGFNSPGQIKADLKLLGQSGCIKPVKEIK